MKILRYSEKYEALLFDLLAGEGPGWSVYYDSAGRERYIRALETSITYIACDDGLVCGYVRCRADDGFGIYVYDLLVRKSHRGRRIGKSLVQQVCRDLPDQRVYVMSDEDSYYEKIGYHRVGSIFSVNL